jgi:hypothetical protein
LFSIKTLSFVADAGSGVVTEIAGFREKQGSMSGLHSSVKGHSSGESPFRKNAASKCE